MKKILLFLFAVSLSAMSYAQFKASPNGIISDDGKGYHVVEFEGLSAEELYKRAVNFVMSYYKNPDKVMSRHENEMINIHAIESDAFMVRKTLGMPVYASVHYNIVLKFKDGKLRIDTPVIDRMPIGADNEVYFSGPSLLKTGGSVILFKKDGKIRNEKAVNGLNGWISVYINNIISYIKDEGGKEENNNDDW